MPKTCAVLNCKAKSVFNFNSIMHKFPNPVKSLDRYRDWVERTRNKKLLGLDPVRVYNNYRICDVHFKKCDRERNMCLKPQAVPSLYLPFDETEMSNILNEGL